MSKQVRFLFTHHIPAPDHDHEQHHAGELVCQREPQRDLYLAVQYGQHTEENLQQHHQQSQRTYGAQLGKGFRPEIPDRDQHG